MEALLLKFVAWVNSVLPSAVGSAMSVYMDREKNVAMSRMEVLLVFVFGISLAHYIGGAVIEHWAIAPGAYIADAIKLVIGFMGMAVLAQLMIQLPEILRAIRKRWVG